MNDLINECHPVLYASEMYADVLNSTSISNHIVKLLSSQKTYKVAPYCYFQRGFVDFEEKKKGGKFSEELANLPYPLGQVDFNDTQDLIEQVVPTYKRILGSKRKNICGLIGVPILDINDLDGEPLGDHYVSYAFDGETLYYFDSAIDSNYQETETFKILILTFNPKKYIANKKTFETAGGVSENPYNYVAQNIFCHSWCFWFLYNFIIKKKTMASIDSFASKSRGQKKDKENLIRIKVFIYEILIPTFGLDSLHTMSLFDSFKYIIVNGNPKKVEQIIE